SVPLRAPPVLAAIANDTAPLPVPLAPAVTVIHGTFERADHMQVARVVTFVEPVPPSGGTDWVLDEIAKPHAAAACTTVNGWPAMVVVPVRAPPVLAAIGNATVPLPLPAAPDVTVIHDTPLVAVHVQPPAAVTATEPVDASAPTFWLAADSANVHGVGGA